VPKSKRPTLRFVNDRIIAEYEAAVTEKFIIDQLQNDKSYARIPCKGQTLIFSKQAPFLFEVKE
jgi:hypothetical protein